jgi:hypothetical protein
LDSFTLGVLRIRAQVEAERELLGGLSLRARELSFQTRSVAAILAADRIRHLIADEVGFGKTVQAMMVAAAVRRREPDRQVFILCPNHLARQWAEELLCRSHEGAGYATWLWHGGRSALGDTPNSILGYGANQIANALHDADSALSDPAVASCLLDSEMLQNPARMAVVGALQPRAVAQNIYLATPRLLDGGWTVPKPESARRLVIVDEWHVLNAQLRNRIEQMLREPETDALLLTATPPLGPLREAYLRMLVPDADTDESKRPYILRNTRAQFRNLFPTRTAHLVEVDPTDAEREAEQSTIRAFREQRALGAVPDYAGLARGLRSEASRHRACTVDAERSADARIDWILDKLSDTWLERPDEAVAIAVGDNPTIDLVSRRLRAAFRTPEAEGAPAATASDPLPAVSMYELRQGADATYVAVQARGFSTGKGARVLLLAGEASDAAYAGLNLQAAGRLIVLSLPADPIMLEQLIGRIDRLGSRLAGATLPIDIVVRKGSILADLYRYHAALGVFNAPYAIPDPSAPGEGNDDTIDQTRDARMRAVWDRLTGNAAERAAWIKETQLQTENLPPVAEPDAPPRWQPGVARAVEQPVLQSCTNVLNGWTVSERERARLAWFERVACDPMYILERKRCQSGNGVRYLLFKHNPPKHLQHDWSCNWLLAIGGDQLGNPPVYTVCRSADGPREQLIFLSAGSPVLDAPGELLLVGDDHRLGQPLRTYSLGRQRLFVLTATRWGCATPEMCGCGGLVWNRADERWLRLHTPDRLDLHVWNGANWVANPWEEYIGLFHPTNHTALRLGEARPLRRMAEAVAEPLARVAIQRAAAASRSGLPDHESAQRRIALLERRARWYDSQIEAIQTRCNAQAANLVPGRMLAANRARIESEEAKERDPHERSARDARARIAALRQLTDDRRANVAPCVRTWWVATS